MLLVNNTFIKLEAQIEDGTSRWVLFREKHLKSIVNVFFKNFRYFQDSLGIKINI